MWQANKTGICTLALGLAALGGAYLCLKGRDALLAQQVVALGFCALLFAVALGTWLSVRRELVRCRRAAEQEAAEAAAAEEEEEGPAQP